MKITNKTLQILSGFCFLAGVIIELVTRKYNANHPDEPNAYGKLITLYQ
jgi:hypothetical protein